MLPLIKSREISVHVIPCVWQNQETIRIVDDFYELFKSVYGVHSKLLLIHNNKGGYVELSSCCERILKSVKCPHPVLSPLISILKSHLKIYSDGGLFLVNFALRLIKEALISSVSKTVLCEIYFYLSKLSVYMLTSFLSAKRYVEKDVLKYMKLTTASIILSKPGVLLDTEGANHISDLLSNIFNEFVRRNENFDLNHIFHINNTGKSAIDSYYESGIFIEVFQISASKFFKTNVNYSYSFDDVKFIKTAICQVSLAGDVEDTLGASVLTDVPLDEEILNCILNFVSQLVAHNVGFVCCQKVIHPLVKKKITDSNILVLDRLGSQNLVNIHKVCGGTVIDSFLHDINNDDLGILTSINYDVINDKKYIHVDNKRNSVFTIILFNQSEEALTEMKYVCEVAFITIINFFKDPTILFGKGIWQKCLRHILHKDIFDRVIEHSDVIGCSKQQFINGASCFLSSLCCISNSLNSNTEHLDDLCHEFNYFNIDKNDEVFEENEIFDLFSVSKNALEMAIEAACVTLNIGSILIDSN